MLSFSGSQSFHLFGYKRNAVPGTTVHKRGNKQDFLIGQWSYNVSDGQWNAIRCYACVLALYFGRHIGRVDVGRSGARETLSFCHPAQTYPTRFQYGVRATTTFTPASRLVTFLLINFNNLISKFFHVYHQQVITWFLQFGKYWAQVNFFKDYKLHPPPGLCYFVRLWKYLLV